ncbi:MAG: glycosyltransferase family 2 protein [Armatimonadia bacterium]
MTITALIPSYGRPDSLLRCMDALAAAELPPDEIIVVVRDTDTPNREVADSWRLSHPYSGLKVVMVSEPGQIAAMNAGLAVATGDIICFPDDDCIPRPDWLKRLAAHYSDPAVVGAGGRDVVHVEGLPEPPTVSRVGLLTWYGRIIGNHHCNVTGGPRPVQHLKGVNMSFRRTLVPPLDRNIRGPHYNDTELSLAVGRHGTLIFDPEAKVDHYPAPRVGSPGGRNLLDPKLAYLDAHDWMYMVRKHLRGPSRAAATLYVLLVGTRLRPGLLYGALQPAKWRIVGAAFRGAMDGLATARHARAATS